MALNGAVIKQDTSRARTFYGRQINYKDLLRGNTPAPQDARPFPTAIGKATGGTGATAAK